MVRKLLIALVVLAAAAAIYVIKNCKCCNPPKPPHVDLEAWWGPETLRGNVDASITPFTVQFDKEMVQDLKQRLSQWREPPQPLQGVGFRYGFNTTYLRSIVDFWRDSYDFKGREQFLNRFPQYKTQIQGLEIHFIHVKPSNVGSRSVVPLLLLHGWPGSVREFYELIPLLTKPVDGKEFVFEVIVPSLPGYGFSSAAVKPGLGALEIGTLMRALMNRLGHRKFYVQGGDWGSIIASLMSTVFPDDILGYHSNCLISMSRSATIKEVLGSLYPPAVVEDEYRDWFYPLSARFSFLLEETGYLHLQSTKPDTIGTALSDSPVGLAAYILEKFSTWTNPDFRSEADGSLTKRFKLVDLLYNVMIYWATNSITTSMRLYAETFNKRFYALRTDEIPTPVPTWGFKVRHELSYQPDGILREKYPNLLGSTHLMEGGHFAAMELTAELASDIFKAVEQFRKFHVNKSKSEL